LESFEKTKEKVVSLMETSNHYYQNKSHQGESRTENLWHSRPQTHLLRYNIDAVQMTNSMFYSNHVMQGG